MSLQHNSTGLSPKPERHTWTHVSRDRLGSPDHNPDPPCLELTFIVILTSNFRGFFTENKQKTNQNRGKKSTLAKEAVETCYLLDHSADSNQMRGRGRVWFQHSHTTGINSGFSDSVRRKALKFLLQYSRQGKTQAAAAAEAAGPAAPLLPAAEAISAGCVTLLPTIWLHPTAGGITPKITVLAHPSACPEESPTEGSGTIRISSETPEHTHPPAIPNTQQKSLTTNLKIKAKALRGDAA